MVESVVRDLRYAVRLLGRSPGFTLTAIVALALGIGINTTIFSVANAVVLQPLSAAEPDRLVRVYSNAFSNTSYAEYADYRDGNRTLDELAAFQLAQFSLRVGAAPEPVSAELVSANYFATLGVHAALGQMPRAVDDLTAEPLVVLDHRFWVRRFDADPDIVGRTLSLNGQPFTVAGVAPDAFTGVMAPFVPALWVPLGAVPRLYPGDSLTVPGGNSLSLHLIGRLGAEVTHAAAQTDLSAIHTRMREAVPAGTESNAVTVHRARQLYPELLLPAASIAGFLMLVAGLVLVITCLNLETLSLARASERRREIGVRRAPGAGCRAGTGRATAAY